MGGSFLDNYHCDMVGTDNVLGKGAFSVVRRCVPKTTTTAPPVGGGGGGGGSADECAAKVIALHELRHKKSAHEVNKIEREIRICQRLAHPNIVKLHETYIEPQCYVLVFELVSGGELFDEIVQRSFYNEVDASACVGEILSAVQACHNAGVIHRDIKPENLLLASHKPGAPVKLTDFGLAVESNAAGDGTGLAKHGFGGTPGYMAPEALAGTVLGPEHERAYGKPVDLWAVGVVAFILLGGYQPFWNEDNKKLFADIYNGKWAFSPPEWDTVSDSAKELIQRLLAHDPRERLTVEQALQHPWISHRESVASKFHRQGTLDELKKFNARRKLKAGVHLITATNRLMQGLSQFKAVAAVAAAAKKGEEGGGTGGTGGTGGGGGGTGGGGGGVAETISLLGGGESKTGTIKKIKQKKKPGTTEGLSPADLPLESQNTLTEATAAAAAATLAGGPGEKAQAQAEAEAAVLQANHSLLDAIVALDWEGYARLTDPNVTCYEPEAPGALVEGLEFHRFYFDALTPSHHVNTTLIDERVRFLGTGYSAALVTYTRLTQSIRGGGGGAGPVPVTSRAEESRIWERSTEDDTWRNVHFHRSGAPSAPAQ